MRPLLLTILICLPLTVFAEQLVDTSEESYEIAVGITTYRDVLENFGSPLYTTKTEDGNQVWVFSRAKVELIEDDSVPEQDASFLIEFDKNGKVLNYEIKTIDEILTFKKERGCEPLVGNKEWFSWNEEYKIEIVKRYIQIAKKNGIIIRQSPEYYVKEVGTVLSSTYNPDRISIGTALRVTAIMDGDWDDGSGNRLGIAHRYLGAGLLKYMRETDPEKYEKLLKEEE